MPRRPPVLRYAALTALLLWVCNAGAAQPDTPPYPNTDSFGVPFEKGEDWHRHCTRVEHLVRPRPAMKSAGMRCNATDLYYLKRDQERTSPAEWRQVRACAEATGDDAVLADMRARGEKV